jgi:hypothetical protein
MNPITSSLSRSLKAVFAAALTLVTPSLAFASDEGPVRSFDFTDSYYRANGIEPSKLIIRPNGQDGVSVIDNSNTDPTRRNVRATQAIPTYDHSGHLYFFHTFGLMMPDAFTNNAAGAKAYELAEKYNLYGFPRKGNAPNVVFPKRQEDLSDLRDGYFSNNPLGLWKINLVSYTAAATGTSGGQAALADLAARNGKDLDGTPIIKTLGELEGLRDSGYVTIHPVATDGSEGVPWFACPIITDPRDGAIAPDSFVDVVKYSDGTMNAESARITQEFNCLKNTGNYCN